MEDILRPILLVQPHCEKCGTACMRDEGPLHIDVHVASDGATFSIADDGLGMEEDRSKNLLTTQDDGTPRERKKGTGIAQKACLNVWERFYDQGLRC